LFESVGSVGFTDVEGLDVVILLVVLDAEVVLLVEEFVIFVLGFLIGVLLDELLFGIDSFLIIGAFSLLFSICSSFLFI